MEGIKRRRRLHGHETDLLLRIFEQYPRPTAAMREVIAGRLGMSPRGVQIWFQNRRAKVKRDLLESGQSMLMFSPTVDLFAGDFLSSIPNSIGMQQQGGMTLGPSPVIVMPPSLGGPLIGLSHHNTHPTLPSPSPSSTETMASPPIVGLDELLAWECCPPNTLDDFLNL